MMNWRTELEILKDGIEYIHIVFYLNFWLHRFPEGLLTLLFLKCIFPHGPLTLLSSPPILPLPFFPTLASTLLSIHSVPDTVLMRDIQVTHPLVGERCANEFSLPWLDISKEKLAELAIAEKACYEVAKVRRLTSAGGVWDPGQVHPLLWPQLSWEVMRWRCFQLNLWSLITKVWGSLRKICFR